MCHKEGEGSWGFLILNFEMSEEIAHAKAAKDGKVYRGFIFLGEEITHAKSAKDGKGGFEGFEGLSFEQCARQLALADDGAESAWFQFLV